MTEAAPLALVVHAIANRTRLRIASRRGDTVFFASIATAMSAMPGIQRVAVQPMTGSVLLEHTKPLPKLLEAAAQARLFRISEPMQEATKLSQPPRTAWLDPRVVVGVGMGAFALWQLTKGRILPPAVTLAWYAASLTGMLFAHDAAEPTE